MSLTASSEALRAATLSFNQKSPPPPKSPSSALTAATRAAQVRSPIRPSPGEIGSSIAPERGVARWKQENTTSPMSLDPSMVAATLAASRHSTSPSKSPEKEEEGVSVRSRRRHFQEELFQAPGRGGGGGGGLHKISPERSRTNTPDAAVDSSHIDDIASLKSLFEKSSDTPGPAIHAPKPVRGMENASLTAAILATQLSPSTCASTQSSRRGSPVHKAPNRASPSRGDAVGKLSPPDIVPVLSLPPLSRGPTVSSVSRGSDRPRSSTESGKADALLAATLASSPKPPDRLQPPQPPPSRRKETKKEPQVAVREASYESEDVSDAGSDSGSRYGTARTSMSINAKVNVSTISLPQLFAPPGPPPLPRRPSIPQLKPDDGPALKAAQMPPNTNSASTSPPRQSPTRPRPIPRHRTGDSILAASLAPSRVVSPSPRKPPAPPAPRRRRSLPPPPKGLRETMRKPRTPPKEPSPHRRKPHLVRHPHKHSQGEGRRWRHFVTEAERKRYDGLWAANKGLLLPTSAPPPPPPPRGRATARNFQDEQHEWSSAPTYAEPLSDCVSSLIVREIWRRSRLPDHQLAEIWELVGREGKARLSRDEFVVGTWLVDQCLKGRKLPAKVQDEVWESVRRLGVKRRE